MAARIIRLPGELRYTRLSYYNYTIQVKNLHIYFVVSVILHPDANLFYLLFTYLYIHIYLFVYLFFFFILFLLFMYIILIFL